MKTAIVTGAAGFIGAHAVREFLKAGWDIICIDSFRHKGQYTRLDDIDIRMDDTVEIYHHDLAVPIDHQLENKIMARGIDLDTGKVFNGRKIDYIFNFASESAVERSAQDPVPCLVNNYQLVINMLEFARRIKPGIFFQISTDEIYGEAPAGYAHKEWDSIIPSSPYAASKAAQEAVAIAYWRTYNVPIVITNTMNIIGEMQDKEKFLPKIINYVQSGQEIPIYTNREGQIGSRVYTDVLNKIHALFFLATKLEGKVSQYKEGADRPDRYNICGSEEFNNLEFAQLVADVLSKKLNYKLLQPNVIRPGYDSRYALDNARLRELGWEQPYTVKETVERVIKYTLSHPEWLI